VFFASPSCEPYASAFRVNVAPVARRLGFTVERADDLYRVGSRILESWNALGSAGFTLIDVSRKDPSVFYHLGMAHAAGKPVFLLTQNVSDVPCELRQYPILVYGRKEDASQLDLNGKLEELLRFIVEKS